MQPLAALICCRKNVTAFQPQPSVANMVKFTVHQLGEHSVENMIVSGPFRDIILTMADLFLATYAGDREERDYHFALHVISMSQGNGSILEQTPAPPEGPVQ